jgi:uncharacterized protein (DUF58 family)
MTTKPIRQPRFSLLSISTDVVVISAITQTTDFSFVLVLFCTYALVLFYLIVGLSARITPKIRLWFEYPAFYRSLPLTISPGLGIL